MKESTRTLIRISLFFILALVSLIGCIYFITISIATTFGLGIITLCFIGMGSMFIQDYIDEKNKEKGIRWTIIYQNT